MSIPKRTIDRDNPYKIVFVCLGNICRSPTAEGVMQHLANERGLAEFLEIDSAGTSAYHVGEPANSKSRQVAASHGVQLLSKARQFEPFDLGYFDLVLAMDRENYDNVRQMDANGRFDNKIAMLRDFDPQPGDGEVPDPYYGGLQGFENVFQVVRRSCAPLLDHIAAMIPESRLNA